MESESDITHVTYCSSDKNYQGKLKARGAKTNQEAVIVIQIIGKESMGQVSDNVNKEEELIARETVEVELTFLESFLDLVSETEKRKLKINSKMSRLVG